MALMFGYAKSGRALSVVAALAASLSAGSLWAAEDGRLEEIVIGRIGDISVPDPNTIGVNQRAFAENVFDSLFDILTG